MNINKKSIELIYIIEYLSLKKKLDKFILIISIETAILNILKYKFNYNFDFEVKFNFSKNVFYIYKLKKVFNNILNSSLEISYSEFLKIVFFSDNNYLLLNEFCIALNLENFDDKFFNLSKKNILDNIKIIEKIFIFNKYKNKKFSLVEGIIKEIKNTGSIINLEDIDAFFPISEYNTNDILKINDKFIFFILEVLEVPIFEYQIILSRNNPNMIIKLFEKEIPELREGIINIVNIVRDSGKKTKISVSSSDSDIDPVGSLVGTRGVRIQNIIKEMRGEKIDIVLYDENLFRYICNSLINIDIFFLFFNFYRNIIFLLIDKEKILFLGNRGINIKLSSELIRCRLKVIIDFDLFNYYEKKYFFF